MTAAQSETPNVKFKGRILLLEDDELFATSLAKQLDHFGIETIWCNDIQKAEEALRSAKAHAIVSDIYLKNSEGTGLDLIQKSGSMGLPIVVITSNADLHIAKESMNSGASFLFQKPFETKDLVEVLQKLWMEPKNHLGIIERFFEINSLTEKEKEIARLLMKGLSNAEIAATLGISDKTVKFHLTAVFGKCGVQSRTELYSTILPT